MKMAISESLSTVPIVSEVRKPRVTQQTLHILTFIHRFRHVHARHIQLSLRHSHCTTTNKLLTLMSAKGYIARQYTASDRAINRPASYHLTPEGLSVLQAKYPERSFRRVASIKADANSTERTRERYHVLADVYAHFKQHYDGHFEYFTTFDIAKLEPMPDKIPDGYIRLNLPDVPTQHYFIEVYGWSRSSTEQRRRLHSYVTFAESGQWENASTESEPSLFVVAASSASQKRLSAQMKLSLESSFACDFKVFTTTQLKLRNTNSTIWLAI